MVKKIPVKQKNDIALEKIKLQRPFSGGYQKPSSPTSKDAIKELQRPTSGKQHPVATKDFSTVPSRKKFSVDKLSSKKSKHSVSPAKSEKDKTNQSKSQSEYSEIGKPEKPKKRPTSAQIKPTKAEVLYPINSITENIVKI